MLLDLQSLALWTRVWGFVLFHSQLSATVAANLQRISVLLVTEGLGLSCSCRSRVIIPSPSPTRGNYGLNPCSVLIDRHATMNRYAWLSWLSLHPVSYPTRETFARH